MRKVVAGLFISLDGVTESPEQWQFDNFDEDMMAGMTSQITAQDTTSWASDLSGLGLLLAHCYRRTVCQFHQ